MITPEGPLYSITFNGRDLICESELAMHFRESGLFSKELSPGKPSTREINEPYRLIVGKAKHVVDHCNELVLPLYEKKGTRRRVDFVMRAYNDGVAFRYEFPEQEHQENFVSLVEWGHCTGYDFYTGCELYDQQVLHRLLC